jgi:hypothetical protein
MARTGGTVGNRHRRARRHRLAKEYRHEAT